MINGAAVSSVGIGQGERQMLPYQEPARTWAGRGSGALCSVCGVAILGKDIEYEVELVSLGGVRNLHFHFNCYRTWESQG